MFSRISFSFSRAFRFRSRRLGKVTETLPRGAPAPAPPKKRRAQTLVIQTPLPSPAFQSLLSQNAQSPPPSAPLSSIPMSPGGPVILIGHEPSESYFITEKEPVVPLQEPRSIFVSTLELPHPNTKRVSFDESASRSTATSRSTTPVNTFKGEQIPPKSFSFLNDPPADRETGEWEDEHTEMKQSKRKSLKRPLSLFSPRPSRTTPQRFSVPALPVRSDTETITRRASKRKSTASTVGTTGGQKKGKRQSRWSAEWHSQETQEVLRALRDMN
ncbi:hypothetical protein BV22DRAFT_1048404 [Leucogyrophana mollusca]|uniref:Uncharacterized protein n=1 Tax=Leucogyrophana mollusca TaxID=85980 RepID=A0ACB8BCY2_9AGAM|nr:hypothetical protein BV22DRAFT_1048404 [Leucogyrophana mollusca]